MEKDIQYRPRPPGHRVNIATRKGKASGNYLISEDTTDAGCFALTKIRGYSIINKMGMFQPRPLNSPLSIFIFYKRHPKGIFVKHLITGNFHLIRRLIELMYRFSVPRIDRILH